MSQENVEIVRPIYEAFNRRDWDALFCHTDPEFTFTYRNPGLTPDAGIRRGREEVVAFAEEYGGAFDKLIWEPENSSTVTIGSWPSSTFTRVPGVATSTWWSRTDTFGRFAAALSSRSRAFPGQKAPSKPLGCGSRRSTVPPGAPLRLREVDRSDADRLKLLDRIAEAVEELEFREGTDCWAVVKASDVMVGIPHG
jgi:SnoaL-like domain